MYCSECGNLSKEDVKFCCRCGVSLISEAANSQPLLPIYQTAPLPTTIVSEPRNVKNTASAVIYSGFVSRTLAYFVDSAILFLGFIVLALVSGVVIGLIEATKEVYPIIEDLTGVLCIVQIWLYFTIAESSQWQATLGKKLLQLKVVDKDGNRISFRKANARFCFKILSCSIPFSCLLVAFSQKKQGLHDVIAKTFVLRRRPYHPAMLDFDFHVNIPLLTERALRNPSKTDFPTTN